MQLIVVNPTTNNFATSMPLTWVPRGHLHGSPGRSTIIIVRQAESGVQVGFLKVQCGQATSDCAHSRRKIRASSLTFMQ